MATGAKITDRTILGIPIGREPFSIARFTLIGFIFVFHLQIFPPSPVLRPSSIQLIYFLLDLLYQLHLYLLHLNELAMLVDHQVVHFLM